jgi:hypothetical protein
MLSYEQVKSLENALGPQAAPPVIEILEEMGNRVKADLSGELATKKELEQVRTEIQQVRTEIEKPSSVPRRRK